MIENYKMNLSCKNQRNLTSLFLVLLLNSFITFSQLEKYEKVILTRYFKPQVTYSTMTSTNFKNGNLKNHFFSYFNESPNQVDDFRNFISFNQSKLYPEISYVSFDKIPNNPLIPDNTFSSMLKTYFKFFISPILLRKEKKKKEKIMSSVNAQIGEIAQKIAKERILNIWGYNQNGYFDYSNLFNEAQRNSNDLEEFISQNSADNSLVYNDIMSELINRNFIIIYNLRDCMNLKELYSLNSTPVYRRLDKDGINILIEAYVFKINWTKENENTFFNNCWFDKNSMDRKSKSIEAFNNMKIDIELVDITSDEANEQYFELKDYEDMGFLEKSWRTFWNPVGYQRTKKLSKENNYEKHKTIIDKNNLEKVVNHIHDNIRLNVDHFKLRSVLSSQFNYSSKIGQKENLYRNQRFVAFELRKKDNGKVVKVYKGVLSSRNPEDNTKNKSVKSKFKQERGSKLYDGMILEEQPLGLYGFSFSYIQPIKAYNDTTVNFLLSLGTLNLNYSRFSFLKGISIDLFGIELSKKIRTSNKFDGTTLLNVQWRPSISRNIFIPKCPYVNLNVGTSFNTLGIFSFTGITPFVGLNVPIGSNSNFQLNTHYGIVFNPTPYFDTYYNNQTQTYELDEDVYKEYKSRISGLSLEAKFLYFPSKKTNQTLKDKKYKL
jgi:hypothetical protein